MPRTCSAEGCNNSVFSHDFCRYHQYMRKKYGGDLYNKPVETRSPKKQYKIPKESKTRLEEKQTYKRVKDEIREELKAQGKYICFFCTDPMGENDLGFHHLKGRDGKNYIDKKYLVPAHNDCHVNQYHNLCVEVLLQLSWYQGFLSRLKAIDESLYREELKKRDKAGLLFEE